eukprot:m.294147 g.294147  ORF g.294147 m.294147 type:complete len:73 (-) comp55131_c1_seq1:107-325(-)
MLLVDNVNNINSYEDDNCDNTNNDNSVDIKNSNNGYSRIFLRSQSAGPSRINWSRRVLVCSSCARCPPCSTA